MTMYAFGAYGTNNIGDEAIFQGLSRKFPSIRQIYINKPCVPNAVWYADFIEGRKSFDPGDHLLIGGGGLLYSKDAVQTMVRLSSLVRAVQGTMSVEGIGCEALHEDYAEDVEELMSAATKITVRSSRSAAILKERFGIAVTIIPDFAFALEDMFLKTEATARSLPRIGLVLSGDAFGHQYEAMRVAIRKYTIGNPIAEFIHIPHSRSYVDRFNNDVIVGEALWSGISIYHAEREERFRCAPFTNEIAAIAATYKTLDAVISERYHGILFGLMSKIPVIAAIGNIKNRSILEDFPDRGILGFLTDEELHELIRRTVHSLNS